MKGSEFEWAVVGECVSRRRAVMPRNVQEVVEVIVRRWGHLDGGGKSVTVRRRVRVRVRLRLRLRLRLRFRVSNERQQRRHFR